jgi:predicted dehydrogenase
MFENSSGQRHVAEQDRYLFARPVAKHNLVIIGTGTIGQEHMRVAALLGRARVHGIYDTQPHSLDVAEKNFKAHSLDQLVRYPDLESACHDPAVDALMICTPNYTHFEVLKIAATSGKAIFLEKPMATTLQDAAAIVEICEGYSAFIQIGLQYRFKAQYLEAFYETLERRSLGDIKTISISEHRPPFLDKVGQWNKFSRFSGGTLVEKCCHYFDLINLLAQARPARVYASGGQATNFLDFEKDGEVSDIEDHAFVVIDYDCGIRASFTLNMFCPDFNEELIIVGREGKLIANENFNFQHQLPTSISLEILKGEEGVSKKSDLGYTRQIEQSGHHGSTYYEHIAFIDQLEGKTSDSATALQGLWSVVVASAAQQSMAEGQAINIDQFIIANSLVEVLA